ncbi:hypothetical protein EJQ19_00890 [Paenibacillus whitsoniae]|uniref:Pirin N-terminal domain-containing protein n=2 Tax=Paenibacillus whitsoniae TaxID=2496558 RepID=A0A3S0ASJ8_9BACL|nr:hypothetical protein EJQ19_00890 [Paenibacillus whitsoniae]
MVMAIRVFSVEEQGTGAFDGGKFVEQRAISFPGEKTAVDRVGPLFYWAWGKASDVSEIGMHPHKAFEIVTYVIDGLVEHRDSLGSLETVTNGGAQVIQAGSGVYHAEAFRRAGSEAMQIWFEPHLSQSGKKPATYRQYNHEELPTAQVDGVTATTVIGSHSPIVIDADVRLYDWDLAAGANYSYSLQAGRSLAFLVIRGSGTMTGDEEAVLSHKDFVVTEASAEATPLVFQAAAEQALRLIAIDVPTDPGYPLYRK